ncbi:hypothetical protein CEP54_012709 [Fusarium duplospermum]|uniref:C2H2-type domain-containing protein n=1 Tax=Fusarium duplospermum TaxID=1325734 RepID=A0A428P750_9HYPO|nr:hypothetical protein CEP54_012709 [Fusarium duplospermum]
MCSSHQDPVIDDNPKLDPSPKLHLGNNRDHATPVPSRRDLYNTRRRRMSSSKSLILSDAQAAGIQPSWQAFPLLDLALDRARHDGVSPITPISPSTNINQFPNRPIPKAATGMIKWKLYQPIQPQRIKVPVLFSCRCCTNRPAIFRTAQELAAHEMKKPYKCLFCTSRFKNKNESLRHQNSMHIRSQSWSCATLLEYNQLFYNSWERPNQADAYTQSGM